MKETLFKVRFLLPYGEPHGKEYMYLYDMFISHGFEKSKIHFITEDNYVARFNHAIDIVDDHLAGKL